VTHIFVSCVATKRDRACEARTLYTSLWFQKATPYAATTAEAVNGRWWILSAKHGLLNPQTVIEPYNETLAKMRISERRSWSDRMFEFVRRSSDFHRVDSVVMLAGERYRKFLVPKLIHAGIEVSVPLAGLGIGRQLQWLGERIPRTC
jgi:hypothetical protein